eukprot:7235167-Prymnesium_polylepis.1
MPDQWNQLATPKTRTGRSHESSIDAGSLAPAPRGWLEGVDSPRPTLHRWIAGSLEHRPNCFGFYFKGLGVDQGLYVR